MRRSRSWRRTLPLRLASKQVRRLMQPKVKCGLPARVLMSIALFPALAAHHHGVLTACKALKHGKQAFQPVLENLSIGANTRPAPSRKPSPTFSGLLPCVSVEMAVCAQECTHHCKRGETGASTRCFSCVSLSPLLRDNEDETVA